jgi:hypothetical protein
MSRWLVDHPEIIEGFPEGWVAVADKRVVAYGEAFDRVAAEAHEMGYDGPASRSAVRALVAVG